jgi:hypothetical protein
MKNKGKIGICFVAVIFIFSALLMSNLAFAQQDQGQQSVRIIVTDGVTGKAAEGVTTLIRSPSGALIQNLGTVPQGGTVVSLAPGQYNVVVQIGIFGFPVTLGSYSFSTYQTTQVKLTVSALFVSALFIPIQYLPLLIYLVVSVIALAIIITVIRQIRKSKKPVSHLPVQT